MSKRRAAGKKINKPSVEVTITSLTLEGQGVATGPAGKVMFVDGAIPGEKVMAKVIRAKPECEFAVVDSVIEPALERTSPRCPHYGVCGACSWQHIDPVSQIEFKQQILLDTLERIGRVVPDEVLQPLTAQPWAYRRKARLGVRYVAKKGKTLVGFREKDGRFLADMSECHILHPRIADNLLEFQQLIHGLETREAIPQIEVAVGDDDCASFVFRHLLPLSNADTEALITFASDKQINIYGQAKGPDSIKPIALYGGDLAFAHPQFKVKIPIRVSDFFQVNGPINQQMVAQAIHLLGIEAGDAVLDLFSGLGNFSLPLAREGAAVVGIEGDAAMVRHAKKIAVDHGLEQVMYYAANLFEPLKGEPWLKEKFNKVLLDPPRAGAKEIIPTVLQFDPECILYVSCHPGTLARDARMLIENDYVMTHAGVMDMFPHTSHVESMALFKKKSSD